MDGFFNGLINYSLRTTVLCLGAFGVMSMNNRMIWAAAGTRPMGSYTSRAAARFQRQTTHRHIEGFHNLIKYLTRLRRDGTLDDDDFRELVKMASAAFIEAEIADRVESVLEDSIPMDYLLRLPK